VSHTLLLSIYIISIMSAPKARSDFLCVRLAHGENNPGFHISQCLPPGSALTSTYNYNLLTAIKNWGIVWDFARDPTGQTKFMRGISSLWLDLLDKHNPDTIAAISISVLVRGFTAGLFKFADILQSFAQHHWSREMLKKNLTIAINPDITGLANKNIIAITSPNFFGAPSTSSRTGSGRKERSQESQQSSGTRKSAPKTSRGGGSQSSNSRNNGGGGKGKSHSSSSQPKPPKTKPACYSHILEVYGGAPHGCSHGARCTRDHDLASMSKETLTVVAADLQGTHGDAVRAHVASLP
jgi:hypothetical protein